MAVPGWPAFACCTASIASVRMVSIDRCSSSVFFTELLVESLLGLSGQTICLSHRFPRMEHLAERRVGDLGPQPLERGDCRTAERRLLDERGGDGAGERIGHQLNPFG